ncbi:Eco57I restriction-modification methylase domain-containing protein [Candidatus Bathyarchaeota archaeon]|nr:Eco57I restriction-modification methylase domain-containing protein [Candidatus Bathyarchaeota archaeon]
MDQQAIEITILNLSLRAVKTREKLPYMADHIRCGNSLIDDQTIVGNKAFKWNEEFKEIMSNGGFDIVIGNPPYVRVQQLDYKEIDFFKSHYEVAHERIDISLMFFELASKLAKKLAKVGFISTTQFMTAEYGRNLRKFLLSKRIEKFVDFCSLPIFEDAITYPAIIIFSNDAPVTFDYYRISKLSNFLLDNLSLALDKNMDGITKLQVEPSSLGDGTWNFTDSEQKEILLRIRNRSNTILLGDFASPSTGITTGADQILLLGERTISLNKIESGILIKTLRGRNIEPWLIRGSFDYSIYPYELDNDGTRLLSVEEMEKMYPNTYSYLLKNKEGLLRRKDSRREVAESKQWYSLIRKGRLDTFRSSKIVTPALTKHNSFAFDNEASAFLTGGAGVFSMIQERFDSCYLLAVLNSKLIVLPSSNIDKETRRLLFVPSYFSRSNPHCRTWQKRTNSFCPIS